MSDPAWCKRIIYLKSTNDIPVVEIEAKHFKPNTSETGKKELFVYIIRILSQAVAASRMNFPDAPHAVFDVNAQFRGARFKDIDKELIKLLVKTLQEQFENCLGTCYIYDAPKSFRAIYGLIKLMIDEDTRKKIKFMKTGKVSPITSVAAFESSDGTAKAMV